MRNDGLASGIPCDVVKNVPLSDPRTHRAIGEQLYVVLLARMKVQNRQV